MEIGGKDAASMFLLLSAVFVLSSGLPVKYDQRQEGEFNVHAHLENFIFVFIPSSSSSLSILDYLKNYKNTQQQHSTKHTAVAVGGSTVGKYIPPSTGIKSSSPDFPAGKSPYKVDLDLKPQGEISNVQKELDDDKTSPAAAEVLIVPSVVISTAATKTEPKPAEPAPTTTTYPTNDITSTEEGSSETTKKEESQVSIDKVDNFTDKPTDSSVKAEKNTEKKEELDSKKETAIENENKRQPKPEKIEVTMVKEEDNLQKENNNKENKDEKEEENKKEATEEKKEDIPTIESIPGKSQKSPKSIDFAVDVPVSRNTKEKDESIPVIDFLPTIKAAKSSKFPSFRHEVSVSQKTDSSDELSHKLVLLKSGLSECGPDQRRDAQGLCQQIKRQRSGQYFSTDSRLSALQFGLSPAID